MASFTQRQKRHITANIRENIAKLRCNSSGIRYLAQELGVSKTIVSQWINGKQTPSIEHLYLMSKIFNVPFQQFCGLPKTTPKRTSDLASAIIVKIASCKNQSGKTLFHNVPEDNTDSIISLITKELQSLMKYSQKAGNE